MTYRQRKMYNRAKYPKTYHYSLFHVRGILEYTCSMDVRRSILLEKNHFLTYYVNYGLQVTYCQYFTNDLEVILGLNIPCQCLV